MPPKKDTLAEDISHDVFLKIYQSKKIPSGSDKYIKAYMFKSAKNMAIDYYRAEKRENKKLQDAIPEWSFCEIDESSILIEGEILATTSDIINSFPLYNRKIFYQRFLGRHRNEISKEKNISSYYIKKIEDEIIKKLREILKKYFGDLQGDI